MADEADQFKVGQSVVLEGTGTHWNGMTWHATIVDIRGPDEEPRYADTIKVQYSDGGFKRFKKDDFLSNVKGQFAAFGNNLDKFGSEDYEWSHDQVKLYHFEDKAFEIHELEHQITRALNKRDFKEAAELKVSLDALRETAQYIRAAEAKLLDAVRREDYNEAELINAQLLEFAERTKQQASEAGITPAEEMSLKQIIDKAAKRALGGGLAGAGAMVIQVLSLMWMRTTMNYQYRHGMSTAQAWKLLYKEGGIPRFYRGLTPALMQGPLSRFGDTAANVGMLTLLNSSANTKELPTPVKTFAASSAASAWRVVLMPLDTIKTIMQVEGTQGIPKLRAKIRTGGPLVMWHGAMGAMGATFAGPSLAFAYHSSNKSSFTCQCDPGHYPWFATYNTIDELWQPVPKDTISKLGRAASMGFCASVVSDTVSNSIRVMKTFRQTSEVPISYREVAQTIIKQDGLIGLFGRGLQTRILSNGLQGIMFSIAWKFLQEKFMD